MDIYAPAELGPAHAVLCQRVYDKFIRELIVNLVSAMLTSAGAFLRSKF